MRLEGAVSKARSLICTFPSPRSTVNGTCVTDEHHAPTVLALAGLSNETTCVSNTVQVLWKPTNVRSPYRYQPGDATKETLEGIRKRGAHCRPELTLMCVARLYCRVLYRT